MIEELGYVSRICKILISKGYDPNFVLWPAFNLEMLADVLTNVMKRSESENVGLSCQLIEYGFII